MLCLACMISLCACQTPYTEKCTLQVYADSAMDKKLPLFECFGRVTAEDIYSEINVPSFPKSAMDGYAVRSSEIVGASKGNPVVLTVFESLKQLRYI